MLQKSRKSRKCPRGAEIMLGDVAKHSFEFHHKVQRGQRASAELMLRIDLMVPRLEQIEDRL